MSCINLVNVVALILAVICCNIGIGNTLIINNRISMLNIPFIIPKTKPSVLSKDAINLFLYAFFTISLIIKNIIFNMINNKTTQIASTT